jgi:hypothetical protein
MLGLLKRLFRGGSTDRHFKTGETTPGYSAIGFPPHRPDVQGVTWRICHERIEVAGVHHRKSAVKAFARDVDDGVSRGDFAFGIRLERDPANPHDKNAIKVLGWTQRQPGSVLLGFVPREIAAELAGKEPIAAQASRYYESGNYIELMIDILEKKPTKDEEAEQVADVDAATIKIDPKQPGDLISLAKRLKRVGRRDDAALLMERMIDAMEAADRAPPITWKDLATIYRQRKEFDRELDLLKKYFAGHVPPGRTGEELRERLDAVRARTAG